MSQIKNDQPLLPSVFDRLIDLDPTNSREPPKNRNQVLRELKQSVRRDLEHLLNTRWCFLELPPKLRELDVSMVNFGIPDLTRASLRSGSDQSQFLRTIENVIRKYEPRFKTVRVLPIGDGTLTDRTLRFRIDAMLHAEPAPEPIVFDSAMEMSTGFVAVTGGIK